MGTAIERKIEQINALRSMAGISGQEEALFDLVMEFIVDAQHNCNDAERDLFGDIMAKLVTKLPIEKKQAAAKQLATIDSAPIKIIRCLALEVFEIAEPVLLYSPVLTSADLIVIIRIRDSSHRMAIATRPSLDISVTSELIKMGDKETWVQLIGNDGAQISAKSYQRLLEKIRQNTALQRKILERTDVPVTITRMIVKSAGEAIRGYLIKHHREELLIYIDDNHLSNRASTKPNFDNIAKKYQTLRRNDDDPFSEQDLARALSQNDFESVICIFAYMTGLPLKDAVDYLSQREQDPALLACKAINLTRETVTSLLNHGPWKEMLTPQSRSKSLTVYESIKPRVAKSVLQMRIKLSETRQRQSA